MAEADGPKRAQEATLSARPSDPRLREAQRLHHEERQFQRQANEVTKQRGLAESEAKDLTVAKASREAEIDQLNKAIDDTRQKLFQAHDRVKAMELEAISVEKTDPGKAADIREAAAAIRADIPEMEKFAGTHEAKRQEAWDQVKDMEVRLEARTADVAKFSAESERLRNLAEERETAAEALEQQRAAEPVRADVPEIEIFEPDRLRTALRDGHRVVIGDDGHIRVFEERGRPMTDEQIDYLESKLPELRHRLGEGWNFTVETDGTIGGNGPWGAHYYASSNGQISEQAMAEVRAAVGQGQDVSIAPDGTIVTSDPAQAVSADQARKNLDTFNREVESGALTERMAAGQGYDLNPDGTGGYSAIAPMTGPKVADQTAGLGTTQTADPTSGPEPTGEQSRSGEPGVEPPTGTTKASMAPDTDGGTPGNGSAVAAADSGQDVTGADESGGPASSDPDWLEGAGVSADTTATEHAALFGQDDQAAAETQESSTGANEEPTDGSDVGLVTPAPAGGTEPYEDPYNDGTFTTPEPAPTYAESQPTESSDDGLEDTTV